MSIKINIVKLTNRTFDFEGFGKEAYNYIKEMSLNQITDLQEKIRTIRRLKNTSKSQLRKLNETYKLVDEHLRKMDSDRKTTLMNIGK